MYVVCPVSTITLMTVMSASSSSTAHCPPTQRPNDSSLSASTSAADSELPKDPSKLTLPNMIHPAHANAALPTPLYAPKSSSQAKFSPTHLDIKDHSNNNPRPFYNPPTISPLSALPKSISLPLGLATSQQTLPYSPRLRRHSALWSRLDSSPAWLVYYFAFNLGLTLYNKRVLLGFPFPWTLTGIHALASTLGSQIALNRGLFKAARLGRREAAVLIAFSVLYTVNIAVSNLSLHLVTVPFHQVVRATTPLFTIILSILYFKKTYPLSTYASLFVVVTGVGFSTYGDYGWTSWGLLLTLLGTLLASLKTVVTNAIQIGKLRLNPLDLLLRMSPLAFIQCVGWSYWTGEMQSVRAYGATQMNSRKAAALVVNGIIAFGLNVVSFTANKKTSALTMTVAANVKQVLTIVLAIFIFDLVITPTNLFGISLTLAGGAYYAKVELERKTESGTSGPPLVSTVKKDEFHTGGGASVVGISEKVSLPR